MRGRFSALLVVVALTGPAAACGGSGEATGGNGPATPAQTNSAATTAPPPAAANQEVCRSVLARLQAADKVSASHGDTPVIRATLYKVLADALAPLEQRSGGEVGRTLHDMVDLLKGATYDPTDVSAPARVVAQTDPRLRDLRARLTQACGPAG